MRIFIAVEFDNETKESIYDLQNRIKEDCKKGNFTYKDNLHLTLKFLGEIDPADIEGVQEAMEETAGTNHPFELKFERIGYFDRGERCIIWVGVDRSKPLVRLYETLEKNLGKQGFKRDRANFSPHITISRETALFYSKKLLIEKFKPEMNGMIVKEISLMESKRINGKLVYKKLYGAKLI